MKFVAYSTMKLMAKVFMGLSTLFSAPKDPAVLDDLMKDELATGWRLQQEGKIRELYWRKDEIGSMVVLEADSLKSAQAVVDSLPFAKKGYIKFMVIPVGYMEAYEGPFLQFGKHDVTTSEVVEVQSTAAKLAQAGAAADAPKGTRVVALGRYRTGTTPEALAPLMKDEMLQEWRLQKADVIRQSHSRTDQAAPVFMMEVESIEAAHKHLLTLPLVSAGILQFDVVPYHYYENYFYVFNNIK